MDYFSNKDKLFKEKKLSMTSRELDPSLKKSINSIISYHDRIAEKIQMISLPLSEKGIIAFGYNKIFSNGDRIILENDRSWLNRFFTLDLYRDIGDQQKIIEMIEHAPENEVYGYLWPYEPLTLTHTTLFNQRKVWNGISLIKKDSMCVEIYHFGADRNNTRASEFYLNNLDFLKRFISHFLCSSSDILKEISSYPLKGLFLPFLLPKDIGTSLNTKMPEQFDPVTQRVLSISLSRREKECLSLLSKGKRGKEIAYCLGISTRTVECYFYTLKRKFGAHTLSELMFLSTTL